MSVLRVDLGDWVSLAPALEAIRREVFIVEQQVPEEMEWDADDATSVHALALLDGHPVGCGRLLPDGHIGRMAVRAPFRSSGVGRALLQALLAEARRRGMRDVVLHAQTHALRFYEAQGFVAEGPEFDEAGIPHRRMSQALVS
ncbi:GNAT family N-acetyltransferase [Methyloversatilis discipulorum]|uniref:GNAT family N-acetyltransferase n=1 Tax=Methyloversatilis discipulorum TaxID=1119528 RepID=UPI0038CBF5B0